ncbi:helicase associated domain-containing protein [Pelagophyceae sp. CCMP2097]|nr:helicase associated domain-containing protein [Pelagophyceae sp. CCMP2097]
MWCLVGGRRLASRAAAAPPLRPGARLATRSSPRDWGALYLRLEAYREAEGHCAVPARFVAADGTKLGQWGVRQRQAHKAGKMSLERVERLEAVAFVWDPLVKFDHMWDTNFELLQAYRAAHGNSAVPQKFAAADGTMLRQWVFSQRASYKAGKMSLKHVERLEAVAFVWDPLADGWDTRFEALQAYRVSHGNWNVPDSFVAADGTKLGKWVATQRHSYKAGKMSPERIDRLEAAGFVWSVLADGWDAYFELLTAYHAAHGDCAVPTKFAAADGTKLGPWVATQRQAYKAGYIRTEHIDRLEVAGFVWTVRPGWDAHFELLEIYHVSHGDCNMPDSFVAANGTKLGKWVSKQRLTYKAGELSPERVERLEAVKFVWDPLADGWDAHFEALLAYRAAHGGCAVPKIFAAADGTKLGLWVNTQRKSYKAGNMCTERVERLEAVAFVWSVPAGGWDAHFEALQAYRASHGDCAVLVRFVATDGTKLGSWAATQRKAHHAGKMSLKHVERLETVAFVWDPLADGWDAHFELLQAYRAAHCDCTVPARFIAADGTKLGQWVMRQRQAYHAGKMSLKHVERLEAVKFVWDPLSDGWDAHFELLQAYRAAHGDCAVPRYCVAADGTKLGRWVDRQRKARKAGKLSAERVERLEAVAFA